MLGLTRSEIKLLCQEEVVIMIQALCVSYEERMIGSFFFFFTCFKEMFQIKSLTVTALRAREACRQHTADTAVAYCLAALCLLSSNEVQRN